MAKDSGWRPDRFPARAGHWPFSGARPPLEGTVSARELADPDSQFVEVNGLSVHYKEMGAGQPVFLLLHGFGARPSLGAR